MRAINYRELAMFLGLWLALIALPASAELYKCPMTGGGDQYSSEPCPGALRQDGDAWVNVEAEQHQEAQRVQLEESALRQEAEESRRTERVNLENAQFSAQQKADKLGWRVVEYVVEGSSSSAGLTYTNETGGTEQQDKSVPWYKVFAAGRGAFASISAQKKNKFGSVTVKIIVDGVEIKSSESWAEHGIASAHMRLH